jgi:hypothetical protein
VLEANHQKPPQLAQWLAQQPAQLALRRARQPVQQLERLLPWLVGRLLPWLGAQ